MTMSSLTTTWSPSSFQLRLAFTARKKFLSSPPAAFLPLRIRIFSISQNRIAPERRRPGDSSWALNPDSTSDGYAGWTNGIVGAGVAGVVLVAGLTFAVISVANRGTSRVEQQMEPLAAQQEVSLASDDHNDNISEDRNDSKNQTQDGSYHQGLTSLDQDVPSSTEKTEASEMRDNGDPSIGDASRHGDVPNIAPLQQEDELPINDTSVVPEQPENEFSTETYTNSSAENDNVDLSTLNLEYQSELQPQGDDIVNKSSLLNDATTNISIKPYSSSDPSQSEANHVNISLNSQLDGDFEPQDVDRDNRSPAANPDVDPKSTQEILGERNEPSLALHNLTVNESSGSSSRQDVSYAVSSKQLGNMYPSITETRTPFDLNSLRIPYKAAVIPAPSNLSTALQEFAGKVLVPAVVDQVQSQALAALQTLKVIEADVQPGDLCTRREYAGWLVSASSALSRSTISKVYPAMYIENVTELAFDDITSDDPDFPFIQGLAEAGLISSKLSRHDMQSSPDDDMHPVFSPERFFY